MRRSTTNNRRRRGGFTLLEVLIVLAILGVIGAMVVPQLLGQQQAANEQATRISIEGIEGALELYAAAHQGRFPEGGQEQLEMLTQPWTDVTTGRERAPFLDKVPLDAWNQPFQYEYPNSKASVNKPAIWSVGADTRNDEGGGDDINNWAEYQQ